MEVYIACLESYNNGILYGKWVDITKPLKEIYNDIRQMLKAGPFPNCEEWAMHDYDGFGDIKFGEHTSLETVKKIALFIEGHGIVAEKLLSEFNMDVDSAKSAMEDCYCQWSSKIEPHGRAKLNHLE